jgi:hypothetical protein
MFCICGKQHKAGYTALTPDLWVCANCKRPSQMVFEKLTRRYAPRNATGIRSVVGTGDGRSVIRWSTDKSGETVTTMVFQAYPRKVDMDQGREVLVTFWQELDNDIDVIREPSNPPELVAEKKVRATTLAEMLAVLMSPFYADHKAVLAESMTRWNARREGRDHESPGLAEAIWNPSTRFDGTPYSEEAEAKARGPKAGPKVQLDDQKIAFIKHCLENGSQTPEVLAGMFSCSVDDIKAAVS